MTLSIWLEFTNKYSIFSVAISSFSAITSPYNLYKVLENIYYLNSDQITIAYNFFSQIRDYFNKEKLDNNIYKYYKNKDNYSKINYTHMIYDYFTKEKTKLIINKSYLYLKSTKEIPTFLKTLSKKDNLFVCDFTNKDYFWLEEI